jgi:poly [ADP-ribose] polymerase
MVTTRKSNRNQQTKKDSSSSEEEEKKNTVKGKGKSLDVPKKRQRSPSSDDEPVKSTKKPGRPAKSVKPSNPEKSSKPEKVEKTAKAEKSKAEKSSKEEKSKPDKQSKSAKPPSPIQPSPAPPAPASAPSQPADPEPVKMVKALKKGRAAVDFECSKSSECHVFEEASKIWCCTLNQADLKENANKFYIIQLLAHDTKANFFYVWNRWGRVGYSGQNALKGPFLDVEKAKAEYNKKFNEKTRGGYIEVHITYEDEQEETKIVKKAEREEGKQEESKLDKRVKDLINLIFDLKTITNTLAEIGYDAKKMPLGKLSQETIKRGMEVLKRIDEALEQNSKGSLSDLSSQFYSLIPHDFGFKQMASFIINSKERLKEKIGMLENLTDMKIATTILEQSSSNLSPVDEHYIKLKCGIKPLDRSDPVFQLLETYVINTHASTHNSYSLTVLDIFDVDKEGEEQRFTKEIDNHMLLWHGSRLTNWVGILSQGLRIAPPEAPVSGYMFGKGVYFADMVSKSANYCFTSRTNNIGILLLCKVALGNINEKFYADYNANNLPPNKHSTKGCGRTAPSITSYIDHQGTKVPIGKGETDSNFNGSLLYNEYIVYDVKQVQMKYLFKIRFDYKY